MEFLTSGFGAEQASRLLIEWAGVVLIEEPFSSYPLPCIRDK